MTTSPSAEAWDGGFFARAVEYSEAVLTGWLDHHGEGTDYLIYVQTWGPWALTKAVNHLRSGV